MDYEDKYAFPPSTAATATSRRSHLGSPLFARKSMTSAPSSVENSPAAPSAAKSFAHTPTTSTPQPAPIKTRRSEPALGGIQSPHNTHDAFPHSFDASNRRQSADFSDDAMSVGSINGHSTITDSPKSDRSSWRLRSAVSGPFLTGPLAKELQTEHLMTPRNRMQADMSSFDHRASGLHFPLAPVLDAIPDTPRGGYPPSHTNAFSSFNSFNQQQQQAQRTYDTDHPASIDGFQLDSPSSNSHSHHETVGGQHAPSGNESQLYPPTLQQQSHQHQSQSFDDRHALYNHHQQQQQQQQQTSSSSAIVRSSNHKNSNEQSLVAATTNDAMEHMADSMAQILAKTQGSKSFNEVQLTTLVQKIHRHMTIMGRTSAAIRDDYNRIKTTLEATISDKRVLEATNYHLQQLVQQYEVERQYFHQYVVHSLQSQSSLLHESMGTLSQTVGQSKHTIDELSARLTHELANIQHRSGSGNDGASSRSDSHLKEILEEIKRAVDATAIATIQQQQQQQQQSDKRQPQPSPSQRSPRDRNQQSTAADAKADASAPSSSSFQRLTMLLAVLLWLATLGGVYLTAKSAALNELQAQQQSQSTSSAPATLLPSDLAHMVDQIAHKLASASQASDVRKIVYSELNERHPQLVAETAAAGDSSKTKAADDAVMEAIVTPLLDARRDKIDPAVVAAAAVASNNIEAHIAATDAGSTTDDAPAWAQQQPATATEPVTDDATNAARVDSDAPGVPVIATKSDNAPVEPQAPTHATIDAVVPTTAPTASHPPLVVQDPAIAEMLRLKGFPTGDFPFDPAGSATDDAHPHPPRPSTVEPVDVDARSIDAAAHKLVESALSDTIKTIDDVVATLEPVATAAAPTADSPRDDFVPTTAELVEIAIENALNPDVIVQSDEPTGSANKNATAAAAIAPVDASVDSVAPASSDVESVIRDKVTAATDAPIDDEPTTAEERASSVADATLSLSHTDESDVAASTTTESSSTSSERSSVAIESVAAPTTDSEATDERIVNELTGEQTTSTASTSASVQDDDKNDGDDATAVAAFIDSHSPARSSSSSNNGENASLTDRSTHVTSDNDDDDDSASLASVLEQFTSSVPFTSLSMALRSLASHFVDNSDDDSALMAATDASSTVTEALPATKDAAQHATNDGSASASDVTLESIDAVMATDSIDNVNGVERIEESATNDSTTEPLTAAATEAVNDHVTTASDVKEPIDEDAAAKDAPAAAAIEAEAPADAIESVASDDARSDDLVTVEVTAQGDVMDPVDAASVLAASTASSAASDDVALDELNAAIPALESVAPATTEDNDVAALDHITAAVAVDDDVTQDVRSTEESVHDKQSTEEPVQDKQSTADASASSTSAATTESMAPAANAVDAADDDDKLDATPAAVDASVPESMADAVNDKPAIDAVTDAADVTDGTNSTATSNLDDTAASIDATGDFPPTAAASLSDFMRVLEAEIAKQTANADATVAGADSVDPAIAAAAASTDSVDTAAVDDDDGVDTEQLASTGSADATVDAEPVAVDIEPISPSPVVATADVKTAALDSDKPSVAAVTSDVEQAAVKDAAPIAQEETMADANESVAVEQPVELPVDSSDAVVVDEAPVVASLSPAVVSTADESVAGANDDDKPIESIATDVTVPDANADDAIKAAADTIVSNAALVESLDATLVTESIVATDAATQPTPLTTEVADPTLTDSDVLDRVPVDDAIDATPAVVTTSDNVEPVARVVAAAADGDAASAVDSTVPTIPGADEVAAANANAATPVPTDETSSVATAVDDTDVTSTTASVFDTMASLFSDLSTATDEATQGREGASGSATGAVDIVAIDAAAAPSPVVAIDDAATVASSASPTTAVDAEPAPAL